MPRAAGRAGRIGKTSGAVADARVAVADTVARAPRGTRNSSRTVGVGVRVQHTLVAASRGETSGAVAGAVLGIAGPLP